MKCTKMINNCKQHGEFESKVINVLGHEIISRCPECLKLEELAKQKEELQAKQQEKAQQLAIALNNSNLPNKYRNFKNLELKESQNGIKDFDYKSNLVIYGGVGTGKTMLASYLGLKAIYKLDKTVRYLYANEIEQKVKETWSTKSSEDSVINEYVNCDILVLDEIGRAKYSDYLFKIFDMRYLQNKITILLGNINPKEIPNILGEAIASRLRENVKAVCFGQIDLRTPKAF